MQVTTAFGFRNLANYEAGLRKCGGLEPGGTLAFSSSRTPLACWESVPLVFASPSADRRDRVAMLCVHYLPVGVSFLRLVSSLVMTMPAINR